MGHLNNQDAKAHVRVQRKNRRASSTMKNEMFQKSAKSFKG